MRKFLKYIGIEDFIDFAIAALIVLMFVLIGLSLAFIWFSGNLYYSKLLSEIIVLDCVLILICYFYLVFK